MKNRKSIMGCLLLLSLVVLLTIGSYGLLQLISLIHIDNKVFLMLISVYMGSLLAVVITLVPTLDEEVKKEKAKRVELEKQLEKSKEQILRYEETLHDIVHNMRDVTAYAECRDSEPYREEEDRQDENREQYSV